MNILIFTRDTYTVRNIKTNTIVCTVYVIVSSKQWLP